MKRLLGLLLALAFLMPLCMSNGTTQNAITHDVVVAGETHCPVNTPDKHSCAPFADPIPNISQVAPRPDSTKLFGATPATAAGEAQLPGSQNHPSPDLHQLSIART